MDFDAFDIAQPEGLTAGAVSSSTTQCNDATFSVTSDGVGPPTICGKNAGYHMIVEARDDCNELAFSWDSSATRNWNIKISQISCHDPHKPPEGCTQWFTETTGTIESYNYQGGRHLANQDQRICIRTGKGLCETVFAAIAHTVSIAAVIAAVGDICAADYVLIPGGFGTDVTFDADRYCGSALHYPMDVNAYTFAMTTAAIPLRTNKKPVQVTFVTNGGETGVDSMTDAGFQYSYKQESSYCLKN